MLGYHHPSGARIVARVINGDSDERCGQRDLAGAQMAIRAIQRSADLVGQQPFCIRDQIAAQPDQPPLVVIGNCRIACEASLVI